MSAEHQSDQNPNTNAITDRTYEKFTRFLPCRLIWDSIKHEVSEIRLAFQWRVRECRVMALQTFEE